MVHINKVYIGILYALCRDVSWNAEGGCKCQIGHFRGSCFTPKVTQFRIDFVIVSSKTTVFENR